MSATKIQKYRLQERLADVVVAYEPIWAIGTGRVATPEQAQEAIAFVRALVADRDRSAGEAVRVLYGGSMTPDNAPELLALPDVDGGLIGGASLEPASFATMVEAARACGARSVGIAGGVSANSRLREDARRRGEARELPVFIPGLALSTDNAAMIAAAGLRRFRHGVTAGFDLNADAALALSR